MLQLAVKEETVFCLTTLFPFQECLYLDVNMRGLCLAKL
jgi:hypothetical protein